MIRNIIFDMGQVLIHWTPELVTEALGLKEADRELLHREAFTRGEWEKLDDGSSTEEEVAAAISSRLPQHLHPAAEWLVSHWFEKALIPMEGMWELVEELKTRGYGIYLLSNAGVSLRKYFNRIPGSRSFVGRYVSAEHKLIKPDREIYLDFLRIFDLKAEECIFIDDRPVNLAGAEAVGIRGIQFMDSAELLHTQLEEMGIL